MIRDDLSANLIHLTRGDSDAEAAAAFVSIFETKQLRGSTRDIRGGFKCVCFSEAPPAKLATLLAEPENSKMRYKPFGVMVRKNWLFAAGGRPVIYQPEEEFELLHPSHRFRHVRYIPDKVDYTWEREWRICTESLVLDPNEVSLVVPTRAWERWAFNRHALVQLGLNIAMEGFAPVHPFPWHFVVLEDIGVAMPFVHPPQ